jgi:hypothetical protein
MALSAKKPGGTATTTSRPFPLHYFRGAGGRFSGPQASVKGRIFFFLELRATHPGVQEVGPFRPQALADWIFQAFN